MASNRSRYRVIAVAGGAALIAIGALTAGCAGNDNKAPSTTTTTTTTTTPATSAAPPSPTQKDLDPNGGNLFTPQLKAPPAPTEPPGVHRHRDG
jgi:hypothetical protein